MTCTRSCFLLALLGAGLASGCTQQRPDPDPGGPTLVAQILRFAPDSFPTRASSTPAPARDLAVTTPAPPVPQPQPQPQPSQPALDPGLVGTWLWEHSTSIRAVDDVFVSTVKHWVTIHADGRYTDRSGTWSSFGAGTGENERNGAGRVTQRGNVLRFVPDAGEPHETRFTLVPGRLQMHGRDYLR